MTSETKFLTGDQSGRLWVFSKANTVEASITKFERGRRRYAGASARPAFTAQVQVRSDGTVLVLDINDDMEAAE